MTYKEQANEDVDLFWEALEMIDAGYDLRSLPASVESHLAQRSEPPRSVGAKPILARTQPELYVLQKALKEGLTELIVETQSEDVERIETPRYVLGFKAGTNVTTHTTTRREVRRYRLR